MNEFPTYGCSFYVWEMLLSDMTLTNDFQLGEDLSVTEHSKQTSQIEFLF